VVFSAGPERQDFVQAPREIVTAVGIDSLEQAKDDPDVHRQDVQLTGAQNPQDGDTNNASTEKESLDWRSVFSSKTERR